jgi:Zn finger protein HypA/HybF involved in hydrogenase expression
MTSQTKHYIEVSDILGIRCECKNCHAVLTLPLAKDVGNTLLKCPRCGKPWTRLENSTHEIQVSEFAAKVETLAAQLPNFGFLLSLEIKPEAKP